MVEVKICGLKTRKDIEYANTLRPDYVGFVFAASQRQVNKEQVKELVKLLEPNIKKVGVFVNSPLKETRQIARECKLDILQFHGQETPEYCLYFQQRVWKALPIKYTTCLAQLEGYRVQGYLLDNYSTGQYGGTGRAFNWSLVRGAGNKYPVILAGGLTAENVVKAIKTVRPQVVDVSSGVEIEGKKDLQRMQIFIERVRGL